MNGPLTRRGESHGKSPLVTATEFPVGTTGYVIWFNGTDWVATSLAGAGIAGASASSTDEAIARFNGILGALQNSGVTIDDSNNITIPVSALLKFINANATISAGSDGILDLFGTVIRLNFANKGDALIGANGFSIYPETHKGTQIGDSGSYYGPSFISGIHLLAGTGADDPAVGGTVSINTTAVGNVGAGEDDLMSYSIPANSLSGAGMHTRFRAAGTIANTVNAKRIRVKYGATTILDTGAAGIPISAAISWVIEGTITRVGATSQVVEASFVSSNATIFGFAGVTTAAETLSGAVTLKLTGEAVANDDISQKLLIVDWGSN